jgi:serine O-acetyltransferase
MIFSDFARYRPTARPSWLRVLVSLPFIPGMVASLVLRTQQVLVRRGHWYAAYGFRTFSTWLIGADFIPGIEVGLGVMIAHPVGVTLGSGVRIGDNCTLANGVIMGVRNYDYRDPEAGSHDEYAQVGDGVFFGAHAAVVGGVTIGDNAVVGANSVVTSDVEADWIVSGIPAVPVKKR